MNPSDEFSLTLFLIAGWCGAYFLVNLLFTRTVFKITYHGQDWTDRKKNGEKKSESLIVSLSSQGEGWEAQDYNMLQKSKVFDLFQADGGMENTWLAACSPEGAHRNQDQYLFPKAE